MTLQELAQFVTGAQTAGVDPLQEIKVTDGVNTHRLVGGWIDAETMRLVIE